MAVDPRHASARQAHRDALRQGVEEIHAKNGGVSHIGGYCNNSNCDVRQVLIRVKDFGGLSFGEVRCPACQSLLLLGDWEHEVNVASWGEYQRIEERLARDNVAQQIFAETHSSYGFVQLDLSAYQFTLDQLAERFRARDAGKNTAAQ